jgi:hypothetical protein
VVILPATPAVGTSAVVFGSGFGANRRVTMRMGSTRSVMRADSAGRIDTTLRVPSRSRPGRRVLVLRSRTRRVRVVVSIARRQSTAASALAGLDGGERFLIATTRALPGTRVRVRGSGLRRRATIRARVGGARAGSARASRRGRLALMAVVPAIRVGAHPLTLRGRGVSVRLPFSVLARPTPSPAPTPPPPPPPPPSPAPPPVVAAAGDIACAPTDATTATTCRQAQTAAAAATLTPTAVLALGDTQYDAGAPDEYAAYRASWGRFDSIVFPVPGDEEYQTAGAAGYFGYFGARAGNPALGYYSFDLGTWHVVALNSVSCQSSCAAQQSWLHADLAAHPAQCTLAYWHAPRFTSGVQQKVETQPLWDELYAAGAEVVLGGHAHQYERFAPQSPDGAPDPTRGIREFVVGTGGKSHDTSFDAIRGNSEVRDTSTFGVLALTLRPGGYDWRFVPEAGASFTDSGSGACH